MGLDNPTHWIPLVVILLLIFGARRLPEIGRSLGHGLREFKQSVTGESQPPQPTLAAAQPTATQPAAAQHAPAAPEPQPQPQQTPQQAGAQPASMPPVAGS